jgi:hypothetical protein
VGAKLAGERFALAERKEIRLVTTFVRPGGSSNDRLLSFSAAIEGSQ